LDDKDSERLGRQAIAIREVVPDSETSGLDGGWYRFVGADGADDERNETEVRCGVQGAGRFGGGARYGRAAGGPARVHPNQIYSWKKQLRSCRSSFRCVPNADDGRDREMGELYAKIGRLTVERDFVQEVGNEPAESLAMVDAARCRRCAR
jgi:hypothetical protein